MSVIKIQTYPIQTKELLRALNTAGIMEVELRDDIKLSTLAENNNVDIYDVLFTSPTMKEMRRKYGFFPIKEENTIGEIVEKMHGIVPL